jgi:glycosyltransferase involved in cell wall biosynthesis
MKILHYFPGFPPYRAGGLIKYAVDLAEEQAKEHSVGMLWPGEMKLFNKTTKIKQRKSIKNIFNYEIINPLPVPISGGIKCPDFFLKDTDGDVYKQFFETFKPDVIHIHTLMGLHRQFLLKAKEKCIKLVYTTHDYFGICPKLHLFKDNSICETKDFSECMQCNADSMSKWQLFFTQHPFYRFFYNILKKIFIIKKAKIYISKKFLKNRTVAMKNSIEAYQNMQKHYVEMFSMMDEFYFNSPKTKEFYCKYINSDKYKIIQIMHKDIKDSRRKRSFDGKLKLLYMSQALPYKGFDLLKNVLDNIYEKNQNFELTIFDAYIGKKPYIIVRNKYLYSELENIFFNNDLLIVPSVWAETFGLVVLEALSYGMPVLSTNRVGSSYLLKNGCGIVCEANENSIENELQKILNDKSILQKINENILKANFDFNFENHVKQMVRSYFSIF